MTIEAGTRLGPYEIRELCGKGGMGEVYRAVDTRLDRTVAVKVLPSELSDDDVYRTRLEREAKALASLSHPNIATLFEFESALEEAGAVTFLVMEYLEGETLEDRIGRGPLPVEEVLDIGMGIAEGVEAAHRQGVVHRDLKPGNVMLTAVGPKVLDFGLARESDTGAPVDTAAVTAPALTGEGAIVGTMPYMAPEQLEGAKADTRSDVWALGCVLYEMMTGERPFRGRSQADLIGAIMAAAPEPPTRGLPLVPARLDEVVRRCLVRDPESRWQSARDVALELGSIASATDAAPRRMPRNAVAIGGIAAALVAVAGLLWLGTRGAPEGEEPAVADVADSRRLVVLPFETTDPELVPVGVGIAESLIGRQTGVWPVVPRSDAFEVADLETCAAAESVGAALVLGGSLQRLGDQLRVTAQLTSCPDREVLWTRSVDDTMIGGFELQDRIADRIFVTVQRTLWATAELTGTGGPGDPWFHFNRRTREDNALARELFDELLAEDRGEKLNFLNAFYPRQQAMIMGWWVSLAETRREMRDLVEGCFTASPDAMECHFINAQAERYSGNLPEAIVAFERATDLGGGQPVHRGILGLTLALAGRSDDGLGAIEHAIEDGGEDDPWLPFQFMYLAAAYFAGERYEEAAEAARRCLGYNVAIDPFGHEVAATQLLAASEALSGHVEQAELALGAALELNPGLSQATLEIGYPNPDYWRRLLDGLAIAGLEF